jgi:hypothetical protein
VKPKLSGPRAMRPKPRMPWTIAGTAARMITQSVS